MTRAPLRVLARGESVELVGLEFESGYYKVRTARGEQGWAWARNLTIATGGTASAGKTLKLLSSTNLRSSPSTQEAPVRLVQASEPVKLLEPAPQSGYYHVQTADGERGWIWARSAVLVGASTAVAALPAAPVAPAPAAQVAAAAPASEPPPAPRVAEPPMPAPPTARLAAPTTAPATPTTQPAVSAPAAPVPAPRAQKETTGSLQVGDVLNKSTAQLAKGMLPEELLRHYEQGEYENRIVPYPLGGQIWEQSFVDATKHNAQTLTVNDRGTIIDRTTGQQPPYVYGIPFPDIDANDPHAGVKVVWNQFFGVWYNGSVHQRTKMIMLSANRVERELAAEAWFKFYDGESAKYRTDNPQDLQSQFLAFALSPSDMQGTAALSWRYRDPNKRDSQWAFVPALRRVRAVSPANRSDGYLGSDIDADDGNFFDGKPEEFEWRVVDRREGLRVVDPAAAAHQIKPRPIAGGGWEVLTNRDGYYGYQTDGWTGLPWALPEGGLARRPLWVIEGKPHDKYYLYGRVVLWIDAETWDGSYHQKFSWNGEHVLTYQVLGHVNQTTGTAPNDEIIATATQAWVVAENFKMHRASMAGARLNSKAPYDRRIPVDTALFDAGQLTRMGK
ncbi:MAG: DUF1329 domain-containing protein [Deltaproteobacteria bacterium]|nr:DUF1329 domain-containing protein [Deltaproteobacteria bacterium]MBI3389877.1 DUF1329 domain-containing protein [Deltaproteobacteria bacterium]